MRAALVTTCLVLAVSTVARAGDRCDVDAGPRDLVKKKGDVVIMPGQDVEQVIALSGNVTVKKGASVRTVIAAKGNVTVEGEVRESVVVVGGHVVLREGGTIKGGRIEVDEHGTSIQGESGEHVSGDFSINGKSLSGMLVKGALEKLEGCRVTTTDASTTK